MITGAARGMGRVGALRLARFEADVVINDVNLKFAEEFEENRDRHIPARKKGRSYIG